MLELDIGSKEVTKHPFELVVQVRDRNGEPTGKTRIFACETAGEVANAWNQYSFKQNKKRKKKKVDKSQLPKAKDADKLLKQSQDYAEKKQKENKFRKEK